MLPTGRHVPVVHLAGESRSLGDMLRRRAAHSRWHTAMYYKEGGRWRSLTWGELRERARRVASGLADLGIARGDRVAILGPTQPPWGIFDLGAQLAGCVSIGVYPRQAVDQIRYILDHSDARVVFVDEAEEVEQVLTAAQGLDKLRAIVPWTRELFEQFAGRDERLVAPERFDRAALDEAAIERVQQAIDPDDVAILIYTSGTTGPPKGAMISHRNILSLLGVQRDVLPFYEDDLSLNFLPMAHAAERVLGFYGRINSGICTAFASSIGAVLSEVQEVQPTLFGSVPRIFEKAYAKIHAEMEKKPPAVQRLFRWASGVARQAAPYRVRREPMPPLLAVQWRLCDRLVYRKIRQAFGGRVRQFVTGAAPIALDILELFWGCGLDIYECYGMTEATVITHANRPGFVKLGTVGRAVTGVEHRIAEDGEVLLRAPFVFKGYFKDQEATAKTVIDGWLHTGDIGSIDADGYLRITDRKKHLIITAGGKNLAPANIEKAIKNQDPLISQVHAHGDRRAYVAALIAPSPIETLEWGLQHGLVSRDELEAHTRELLERPSQRSEALERATGVVIAHPEYGKRIAAAVRAGNRELAQVEQVRRFRVLERDFSQEHGELTPTMKLKRKEIESKFAELFDKIYEQDGYGLEP